MIKIIKKKFVINLDYNIEALLQNLVLCRLVRFANVLFCGSAVFF